MNRSDLERALSLVNFDYFALAAAGLIMVLSLLPPARAAGMPVSGTANHILAYAVLTFLALIQREGRAGQVLVLAAIAAFGGTIELVQPLFARAAQFTDFLANIGGSAIAGAALPAMRRVSAITGP